MSFARIADFDDDGLCRYFLVLEGLTTRDDEERTMRVIDDATNDA
jgi:hypothetical protein